MTYIYFGKQEYISVEESIEYIKTMITRGIT